VALARASLTAQNPLEAFAALERTLDEMGYPVARIQNAAGRCALMVDRGGARRAAVIPVDGGEHDLRSELRELAPNRPLTMLAYGGRPDAAAHRRLSQAGVELGLFEPLDANVLRFQVNRALAPATPPTRSAVRAPLALEVDVRCRLRTRRERLYTLSSAGAFLLSDEPLAPGRRVSLRVPVGMLRPEARGRVVLAKRPGDTFLPELPAGMAISFRPLDGPSAAVIDHLVAEQLAALAIRPGHVRR
jgi:hypothetical protein